MRNLIKARHSPPRHQVSGPGSEGGVVRLVVHVGWADEVVGELRVFLLRLNHQDWGGDEEVAHQRRPTLRNRSLKVGTPANRTKES